MNYRIGYLEEYGYAAEGNVIRHGDVLRDMKVDESGMNRMLGMIGALDTEMTQSELLDGDASLAHILVLINGNVHMLPVCYTDQKAHVYGLDPDVTGIRQIIRVEMLGFQVTSVVTVIGDDD